MSAHVQIYPSPSPLFKIIFFEPFVFELGSRALQNLQKFEIFHPSKSDYLITKPGRPIRLKRNMQLGDLDPGNISNDIFNL